MIQPPSHPPQLLHQPDPAPPLLDHPLRYEMVNELHARPSPRLTVPCTAVYIAFKEPRDAANRDRSLDLAHLSELVTRHGAPAAQAGAGMAAACSSLQPLNIAPAPLGQDKADLLGGGLAQFDQAAVRHISHAGGHAPGAA